MIVTYTPAGGDKRQWPYKPADLPSLEAEDIEEILGKTFDEFNVSLLQGGAKARRALLWVFLRRERPSLRFADVSCTVGEVVVEWDPAERTKVRAELERMSAVELSDQDRAAALRILDEEDQADPTNTTTGQGEDPKDPTPAPSEPDG